MYVWIVDEFDVMYIFFDMDVDGIIIDCVDLFCDVFIVCGEWDGV